METRVEIREARQEDISGLLLLYTQLGDVIMPDSEQRARATFERIAQNEAHHLLVAVCDGTVAASVTVTVIQSLTHAQRPYAVVEHVVTHSDFRRRGLASALLGRAREIAQENECYKLMLITGRKDEGVHKLYRSCGYHSEGKTAYVLSLIED